jgi:gamma-glutamyltranspeptidase/glutathione hydrolase
VKVPSSGLVETDAASLCDKVDPDIADWAAQQHRSRLGRHDRAFRRRQRRQHGVLSTAPCFVSALVHCRATASCCTTGGLFSLDPKSPNVITPQKRPFNTLAAGFVMKDKAPLMTIT